MFDGHTTTGEQLPRASAGFQDAATPTLDEAWRALAARAASGEELKPDAYRVAFVDPEFLLRPETRGIRFQLELLKPDLGLQAAGINHTVVVYGSARIQDPETAAAHLKEAEASGDAAALARARRATELSRYYAAARTFARTVAEFCHAETDPEHRFFICTGGGPGIMEAANRGAHDAGMPSVALNIVLPHEQQANRYVTPELAFKFHYFALRKMHFMLRARAVVAFPGGFGTLDELFEVLTLVQTHKARPMPVVLFGADYWQRLLDFDLLEDMHTISPGDRELFTIVDDVDDAWRNIRDFYRM